MEKQITKHNNDGGTVAGVGESRGFDHSPNHSIPTSDDKNCYMFDGYKVRERFDPDGPLFTDCIVRVFS